MHLGFEGGNLEALQKCFHGGAQERLCCFTSTNQTNREM